MPVMGDLVLMSKDGNTELYRNYDIFNTSITIQDEIDKFVSAGINVTAVSATAGGQIIDPTSSVMDYVGSGEGLTLYDATPQAETITGFYLDGAKYEFEGGGIEVDANSPIQLTKIRAGTQAQYEALGSYDATTVYLII